jgi:hypothetical protein
MISRGILRAMLTGLMLIVPIVCASWSAAQDFSKISIEMTQPIQEGKSEAQGQILNLPANSSLHVQVWVSPEGKSEPKVQMALTSPGPPPTTKNEVDVDKTGNFSLQFSAPIAAGQTYELRVVKDDGTDVNPPATLQVTVPAAISIPGLGIILQEPVTAGSSKISGRVTPMPDPLVAPVAASGGKPATMGNYPGIVVWWTDPATCVPARGQNASATDQGTCAWSQAAPTVGANPPQFLSVNSDGGFDVTLPSQLKAGQQIRVDVVPPTGRSIVGAASLSSGVIPALTDANLNAPTISTSPLTEGAAVITGNATPPPSGITISIAIARLKEKAGEEELGAGKPNNRYTQLADCLSADNLKNNKDAVLLPLTSSAGNTYLGSVDATTGAFKVTLAQALKEGEWIQAVQVLPADAKIPDIQQSHCASTPMQVKYPFEFYRTNLTFVAGVLLSNSSASSATNANFSQANQFYAFNADHAWRLPGYDCIGGFKFGDRGRGRCDSSGNMWHSALTPGISTFFEGRLTSIPVSTASAQSTTTSSTNTSTSTTSTLLTSQKVFRVETGAFFPWVVRHGPGEHPGGLFLAPVAKAGFDTLTGATSLSNVILPGGATGTLDFQSAYNFFVFGGRLGNMALSQSSKRAPQIEHYLDVTIGRYSNLQSFICHPAQAGQKPAPSGSSCSADYPSAFPTLADAVDSRKQLYRLDFEGLVKIPIPATLIPFYIGFNANIAQHTVGAVKLDHGFAPPDDIRILLGTKFDIGTLLSSLNLGTH